MSDEARDYQAAHRNFHFDNRHDPFHMADLNNQVEIGVVADYIGSGADFDSTAAEDGFAADRDFGDTELDLVSIREEGN